jgi:hypothetical protein
LTTKLLNGHEMYQIAIKCITNGHKIYQQFPFQQRPPKYTLIGIFGVKIHHLASLTVWPRSFWWKKCWEQQKSKTKWSKKIIASSVPLIRQNGLHSHTRTKEQKQFAATKLFRQSILKKLRPGLPDEKIDQKCSSIHTRFCQN